MTENVGDLFVGTMPEFCAPAFYGNVILPFVDRFPKDTRMYRLMTTRLADLAAAG